MQIHRFFALVIVASFLFGRCNNRENRPTIETRAAMSANDSVSKIIMQTFTLPYFENMKFDSGSLVFYCSRAYDTSSLIEIKEQKNLIRGVYYEILPEYHRFVTDYADTSSKLIFFNGYSFTVDPGTWKSVTDQAKVVLEEKEGLNKNLKYTDGATYALYYDGQSRHGNSNDEASFVKFDRFLKGQFLERYKQLRKPIMHKSK
ncbi:MAG: hypothetical protein J0H74_15020 [Chitinophagaceae bacterium]|nr:hypothetical protein [Chitinophagaceae bacterium]